MYKTKKNIQELMWKNNNNMKINDDEQINK